MTKHPLEGDTRTALTEQGGIRQAGRKDEVVRDREAQLNAHTNTHSFSNLKVSPKSF